MVNQSPPEKGDNHGWYGFECAPLDGTPVIFMHDDGSGAFMVFFAAGAWWEADENSSCHGPWAWPSEVGGSFWCHVPPSLKARADACCADQREWIRKNWTGPSS